MTRAYEHKDPLERAADELLADDTRRRGSGLSRYPRSPGREVLTGDWVSYSESFSTVDDYPSDQPAILEDNIRSRYLAQMVSKLSARQRECVELVIVRGMSERQAGAELGIKGGTVSKHLKAAVAKLRSEAGSDELFSVLFPDMDDLH